MRIPGAQRATYLVLDAGVGWRPIFMEQSSPIFLRSGLWNTKCSVPVATHFLVCVMNGTSFFNRMLPRTRIALFGANVSFELDWAFRKLVRLLGLRTGRFRGRLSCCVRPWPFCDGMFSRVGLWPFCVLHVFPCWTPSFLGNRVPKYGKMAEICGCERSLGSISVESTYSDSITPGQNSRFRPRSQNHRS